MEILPMNPQPMPHNPMSQNDNDLWKQIADRVKQLPADQRHDWQMILATLQQRDQMTLNALKLAESGLQHIASKMVNIQPGHQVLKTSDPMKPETTWRVDPKPGSSGCMWLI